MLQRYHNHVSLMADSSDPAIKTFTDVPVLSDAMYVLVGTDYLVSKRKIDQYANNLSPQEKAAQAAERDTLHWAFAAPVPLVVHANNHHKVIGDHRERVKNSGRYDEAAQNACIEKVQEDLATSQRMLSRKFDKWFKGRDWKYMPDSSVHAQFQDEATARAASDIIIDYVHAAAAASPHPQAPAALEFVLSSLHAERDVVLIDAGEVVAFGSGRRMAGCSREGWQDDRASILIATRRPPWAVASIFLEEAAHGAILDMYNNHSNPYNSDDDPRKKLMEEALAKDFPIADSRQAVLRSKIYAEREWPAEMPAKILTRMIRGDWTENDVARFPHMSQFVEQVILPDFRECKNSGAVPAEPSLSAFKVERKALSVFEEMLVGPLENLKGRAVSAVAGLPWVLNAKSAGDVAWDRFADIPAVDAAIDSKARAKAVVRDHPTVKTLHALNAAVEHKIDVIYKKTQRAQATIFLSTGLIGISQAGLQEAPPQAPQPSPVKASQPLSRHTHHHPHVHHHPAHMTAENIECGERPASALPVLESGHAGRVLAMRANAATPKAHA